MFFAFGHKKHQSFCPFCIFFRGMTYFGQEWLCRDRIEHSVGRDSTCFDRSIPNPGQEWSCRDRIEHSVGRDSTCSDRSIPNPGQERPCRDWIKHSVGRDSTCSYRRIPNLGQEWSCRDWILVITFSERSICGMHSLFLHINDKFVHIFGHSGIFI